MDLFHVTPCCNVPNILREGLVPQIGLNSETAGEKVPGIYLFKDLGAVENALLNWLGDEFEDTPLSLLRVHISEAVLMREPESFEYVCRISIHPENIQVVAAI